MRTINCKYPHHTLFFTDGSKSLNKTASAFWSEHTNASFRLYDDASICTAELFAIQKCVEHIKENNIINALICSDSMSSIQMISVLYAKHPIVTHIQDLLYNNTNNITFFWVPSHSGIIGNENVDKHAKLALLHSEIYLKNVISSDLTHNIKSCIWNNWQEQWSQVDPNNKLYSIKKSTHKWKTLQYSQLSRKEDVCLTRIRLGHTRITHEFLMKKETPPICDMCNIPTTILHIIENCPKYSTPRINSSVTSIHQASPNNQSGNQNIIQFLTQSNLMQHI